MSMLAKLRKEHEMTQADLGKMLHVSAKTVGAWERGDRNPKGADMQQMEDFFGVPKERIFPATFSYSK